MLLDILNQYSPSKSPDEMQSELINMYLEADKAASGTNTYEQSESVAGIKGKYRLVAYPTFGLDVFCDTGKANVRAIYEQNEVLYVVAGNTFYSINSSGVKTSLGTLNTSTGFAKIEAITGGIDTNNQLVIIDGTNGYQYNIGTAVATFPITDIDFNQTSDDMTAQDDYFITKSLNSMSFYLSNLSDGTSWDALDFGSKFRKADRIVAIKSHKGELWLIGSKTTEVWTNTGNALFPFERRSDIFIEIGCAAARSVVIAGDSLIYLAKSRTGGYGVAIISGYEPLVVSTKSIMYQFSQLTTTSDCIAYAYAKDGHEFVDFTFPTDNKTFTLDLVNNQWHLRQSYISSTYGRFLGNCHAFCYGKSLIGDFNSGKIYTQSSSTYTENGTAIRRRYTSPPVYSGGNMIYMHRLQIDMQSNIGNNKTFLLELSRDRGQTWETVDTYTVPTSGLDQIYTTSLGAARTFTFRITTTDNFNFTMLGFQAELTVGMH